MGEQWQAERLKWGFEFADGRRATNIDPWSASRSGKDAAQLVLPRPMTPLGSLVGWMSNWVFASTGSACRSSWSWQSRSRCMQGTCPAVGCGRGSASSPCGGFCFCASCHRLAFSFSSSTSSCIGTYREPSLARMPPAERPVMPPSIRGAGLVVNSGRRERPTCKGVAASSSWGSSVAPC